MSLSEKWVNLLFRIVTGRKILKNIMTPFGGLIFISTIASFIFLSFYLDKLFNLPELFQDILAKILGLIIVVPGMVLSGSCIYIFIKSKGTPVPINPPLQLITDGLYGSSRNPMLAGLVMQLFGFGIFCNSISLSFIITPAFLFLSLVELKLIEEPELEKRFGDKYSVYRKSVPMFFPGFFKK